MIHKQDEECCSEICSDYDDNDFLQPQKSVNGRQRRRKGLGTPPTDGSVARTGSGTAGLALELGSLQLAPERFAPLGNSRMRRIGEISLKKSRPGSGVPLPVRSLASVTEHQEQPETPRRRRRAYPMATLTSHPAKKEVYRSDFSESDMPLSYKSSFQERKNVLRAAKEAFLYTPECYDFSRTTEKAYCVSSKQGRCYGRYAAFRQQLDYSYHSHYTEERQHFQDCILDFFLTQQLSDDPDEPPLSPRQGEGGAAPQQAWIVFTAGAMGAGKSRSIKWLNREGYFPRFSFIKVDLDEIRQCLPELPGYREVDMGTAGTNTHKEAGYIAEVLTLAALALMRNVLIDGSLQDHAWFTEYFSQLRRHHPTHRIGIIHITAPEEVVLRRAAKRAQKTGRIVPEHMLHQALKKVPESIKVLKDQADYYVHLHNDDDNPPEIATKGQTFETFKQQWTLSNELQQEKSLLPS